LGDDGFLAIASDKGEALLYSLLDPGAAITSNS